MRLSLLLQREPFGSILEKTLSAYWSEIHGAAYTVRWDGDGDRPPCWGQRWLMNQRLNSIFAADGESAAFEPVRREYGRATQPWLRPLQWSYVQAASRWRSKQWLASPGMCVSPAVPDASGLLILGGNSRIRALDHAAGKAHVIPKVGFDNSNIERELAVRELTDAAPDLIEVGPNNGWYTENYVLGTPLNRVGNSSRAERAFAEAAGGLQRVHARTKESSDVVAYAEELCERVQKRLATGPLVEDETREALSGTARRAQRAVVSKASGAGSFEAVQAHGDFQPANILVGADRTWLIDWEHTSRRQSAYDPLVFSLRSRFPEGLGERIASALHRPDRPVLVEWSGLGWSEKARRALSLSVFVLEELDFYVSESLAPALYGPTPDLPTINSELPIALAALETA